MERIKNPIIRKARQALLTRSISIPSFNNKPITLKGMPYSMSGFAISSDNFGFYLPKKKPMVRKGIILKKRELIELRKSFIK